MLHGPAHFDDFSLVDLAEELQRQVQIVRLDPCHVGRRAAQGGDQLAGPSADRRGDFDGDKRPKGLFHGRDQKCDIGASGLGSQGWAQTLDLDAAALFMALAGGLDHAQRKISVFQIARPADQAGYRSMEVRQKLLAHGPFAVQRFLVVAHFVKPDERGWQIDERDPLGA